MEPFHNKDCDSGGSMDLLTKNGMCMERVICSIMEPEKTKEAIDNPILCEYYEKYKECHENNPDPLYSKNKKLSDIFRSIWRN